MRRPSVAASTPGAARAAVLCGSPAGSANVGAPSDSGAERASLCARSALSSQPTAASAERALTPRWRPAGDWRSNVVETPSARRAMTMTTAACVHNHAQSTANEGHIERLRIEHPSSPRARARCTQRTQLDAAEAQSVEPARVGAGRTHAKDAERARAHRALGIEVPVRVRERDAVGRRAVGERRVVDVLGERGPGARRVLLERGRAPIWKLLVVVKRPDPYAPRHYYDPPARARPRRRARAARSRPRAPSCAAGGPCGGRHAVARSV